MLQHPQESNGEDEVMYGIIIELPEDDYNRFKERKYKYLTIVNWDTGVRTDYELKEVEKEVEFE